jgi:hypothetical protein
MQEMSTGRGASDVAWIPGVPYAKNIVTPYRKYLTYSLPVTKVTRNVGTMREMAPSDSRQWPMSEEPVALRPGYVAASERASMSIAK